MVKISKNYLKLNKKMLSFFMCVKKKNIKELMLKLFLKDIIYNLKDIKHEIRPIDIYINNPYIFD